MKYSFLILSIIALVNFNETLCSNLESHYPEVAIPMSKTEEAMYNLLSTTQQHYQSSIPVNQEFDPHMSPEEYQQLIAHRSHLPTVERLRLAEDDKRKFQALYNDNQRDIAEASRTIIGLAQQIHDSASNSPFLKNTNSRTSYNFIPKKPKSRILMIFCCCSNNRQK